MSARTTYRLCHTWMRKLLTAGHPLPTTPPVHASPQWFAARQVLAERNVLLEFTRATLELNSTIGHPEATVEDERRAEARYDAALPAARALAYPVPAAISLPDEARAIGAALDCDSLEQGEPA